MTCGEGVRVVARDSIDLAGRMRRANRPVGSGSARTAAADGTLREAIGWWRTISGSSRIFCGCLWIIDCDVTVVPAKTSAEDVLAMKPQGVFLSNGPGDPEPITYAIENIRKLVGQVPIFGICLGHQLCGLALGGKTFKLKFGHHGVESSGEESADGESGDHCAESRVLRGSGFAACRVMSRLRM